MKTLQLHFGKALVCALLISSVSCSTDETVTIEDENSSLELRNEITDADIIAAAITKMQNEPIEDPEARLKALGLLDTTENTRRSTVPGITTRVRRYYSPSATMHTLYASEVNRGFRIGNQEGVAFTTKGSIGGLIDGVSAYRLAIMNLNPSKTDFVLTTNGNEDLALLNAGWTTSGTRGNLTYVYRNGGSGRRPLYRFFKGSISDHLFTKNYSEGINNGYAFEGVVGFVY